MTRVPPRGSRRVQRRPLRNSPEPPTSIAMLRLRSGCFFLAAQMGTWTLFCFLSRLRDFITFGTAITPPGLGRLVQIDPLGLAAGDPNIYRPEAGSPVTFDDALGERTVPSSHRPPYPPPYPFDAFQPDPIFPGSLLNLPIPGFHPPLPWPIPNQIAPSPLPLPNLGADFFGPFPASKPIAPAITLDLGWRWPPQSQNPDGEFGGPTYRPPDYTGGWQFDFVPKPNSITWGFRQDMPDGWQAWLFESSGTLAQGRALTTPSRNGKGRSKLALIGRLARRH